MVKLLIILVLAFTIMPSLAHSYTGLDCHSKAEVEHLNEELILDIIDLKGELNETKYRLVLSDRDRIDLGIYLRDHIKKEKRRKTILVLGMTGSVIAGTITGLLIGFFAM